LLLELARSEGRSRPGRMSQLGDVGRFLIWNTGRLLTRRWKRYGRAAVVIGKPVSLSPWFDAHPDLFELPRTERLARVQALCDDVMQRIGMLVPVTAVALACAAIQSI